MENTKTYLVSDLASELNIPRTTVNDWLRIYAPYLESELRGKRKVYPERTLRILQEVKAMRDSGSSQNAIEQLLADRYGIRPEPVLPEEPREPAAPPAPAGPAEPDQPVPAASEALVRQDAELKELFQRMLTQEQERQTAVRSSARKVIAVMLLLVLVFAAGLIMLTWYFSVKLAQAESAAAQRQQTADQAIAAAAQHLTEIRKLQHQARTETEKHASQLEKLTVTLDRTRQDYQAQTAKLARELEASKKEADQALQTMRKDEATRRQAEIAELKRTFAAGQKALLNQYEQEKAARKQAEAQKSSAESELAALRTKQQETEKALRQAAEKTEKTEKAPQTVATLPAADEKKGESHD